jgi:hypothetical protein
VTADAGSPPIAPSAEAAPPGRRSTPIPALRRVLARALAADSAWSAVTVWAVWAAVLLVAVVVSQWVRPHEPSPNVVRSGLLGEGFLWPLRLWDYSHYLTIAHIGYPEGAATVQYAFFPLWPAILALGEGTIGAAALGTIVAVAASAAAFVGVAVANPSGSVRRTAIALACVPSSYVLLLVYPDGLALAAAVWACILASRDRWAAATFLGLVAALARPNGFLVALALLFLARRATGKARWVAVAVPPLAFCCVMAYFWWRSGSMFAFTEAQAWARGHPWEVLLSPFTSTAMLWDGILAGFAVVLCVLLWRSSLDRMWPIYATAVLAMSLGSGTVWGAPRHMLFAFPLIWAAADTSPRLRWWPLPVLGACLSIVHVFVMVSHVP